MVDKNPSVIIEGNVKGLKLAIDLAFHFADVRQFSCAWFAHVIAVNVIDVFWKCYPIYMDRVIGWVGHGLENQ